jgi:hypothetical protein
VIGDRRPVLERKSGFTCPGIPQIIDFGRISCVPSALAPPDLTLLCPNLLLQLNTHLRVTGLALL